ncbi:MAG: RNA methyltransferase [Flavobacteriales bacterium]
MTTKAVLKHARSLHQKKFRELSGGFLVQGERSVRELLGSGWPVQAVFATEAMARVLGLNDADILPTHEMDRIGTLESGNDVVAVVRKPHHPEMSGLEPGELVIALDGIADPGNMGTVLRMADWFGVRRVLCGPDCVEEFNPKCVQASMGGFLRVEVHRHELVPKLQELRSGGATIYLASMEGASVFETALRAPAVLVMGSEAHGVSEGIRALQSELISVPRLGGAESLNVAMAASALCMEFTRQRLAR